MAQQPPTDPAELSDEELLEEYREACHDGPVVRIDELQLEIAQRWEDEQERPEEMVVVDGRFTSEGISVSAYNEDGSLFDEAWFTYDEMDDLKGDGSDFTFEREAIR